VRVTVNTEKIARFGDWSCTYTGLQFWPLDPRAAEICIEDIAHALSLLCRFGGHCRSFYSVAQHSVLVSWHCDEPDALWGLLHDASEAYLMDLPRPIKHSAGLERYREAEQLVMQAACDHFGLPTSMPESVERADESLLATEARDLMPAASVARWTLSEHPLVGPIEPWSPERAEKKFLDRFHKLVRQAEVRQASQLPPDPRPSFLDDPDYEAKLRRSMGWER
jgi:hypothetical protein